MSNFANYSRRAFPSLWRLCLLIVGLLFAAFPLPSTAAVVATSGTFSGVYHRDRWGVGRFNIYLVSPKLHEQLKEFGGRPISLQVKAARQAIVPGPCEIVEIGRIQPLERARIELKLVLARNDALPQGMVEFTCFVENRGERAIDFSTDDLFIRLYSPRPVKDGDARHMFFRDFTNHQMSVHDLAVLQWLSRNFVETRRFGEYCNLAHGHRVELAAGERVSFVIRRELPSGEYEARVRLWSRLANATKWDVQIWRSFDLPGNAKAAKEDQHDDPASGLVLGDVEYRTGDLDASYLSFTLRSNGGEARKVLACAAGPDSTEAMFAGVVTAFDGAGKVVAFAVAHQFHCSQPHELWLPAAGRNAASLWTSKAGGCALAPERRRRRFAARRAGMAECQLWRIARTLPPRAVEEMHGGPSERASDGPP